jgi:hypothetical protein
MTRAIPIIAAACLSVPLGAQTYKWVDERGGVVYGDKPPASRSARLVDTEPNGTVGAPGARKQGAEGQVGVVGRPPAPAIPAEVAAPAPQPVVRGMEFETYIRLQSGMTEGELLLRAGSPDQQSVESFRDDVVKSYYYLPTPGNPYITLVTLRGGRIANIERTRKTF